VAFALNRDQAHGRTINPMISSVAATVRNGLGTLPTAAATFASARDGRRRNVATIVPTAADRRPQRFLQHCSP
jgi:hypothetical protein